MGRNLGRNGFQQPRRGKAHQAFSPILKENQASRAHRQCQSNPPELKIPQTRKLAHPPKAIKLAYDPVRICPGFDGTERVQGGGLRHRAFIFLVAMQIVAWQDSRHARKDGPGQHPSLEDAERGKTI
jgi:hypothetical protein